MLVYGSLSEVGSLDVIRDTLYQKAIEAGWTGIDATNKIVQHGADPYFVHFRPHEGANKYYGKNAITPTTSTQYSRYYLPVVASTATSGGAPSGAGQGVRVCVRGTPSLAVDLVIFCRYVMDADLIAAYIWADEADSYWMRGCFATFALAQKAPFGLIDSPFFIYGQGGSFTGLSHIRNPALATYSKAIVKSLGYDQEQAKYYIDRDPYFIARTSGGNATGDVLGGFSAALQDALSFLGLVSNLEVDAYWNDLCFSNSFEVTLDTKKFFGAKIHRDDYSVAPFYGANYASVMLNPLAIRSG